MRFSWTGGTARSVSLAVVAVVGTARGWTVAQTVAGVCLWAVCACVAMRVAAGRPRSLLGNTLSRRHKGRRFKLYAMPINHYGEKARWCLDLIGAKYEEEDNGGLLSFFLWGKSVPSLDDRRSGSHIGNSDEILQFLAGTVGADSAPVAQFFERSPSRRAWEKQLSEYGHHIQRWGYTYLLAPTAPRDHPLMAWGAYDPRVPFVDRLVLRIFFPIFKFAMRRAFRVTHAKSVDAAKSAIMDVLQRADDALRQQARAHLEAKGVEVTDAKVQALAGTVGYLAGGDAPSYVDVSFCALTGVLMPANVVLSKPSSVFANGRFTSFMPRFLSGYPVILLQFEQDLLARPCGVFIQRMYKDWRANKLVQQQDND